MTGAHLVTALRPARVAAADVNGLYGPLTPARASPLKLKNLKYGKHKIQIRAIDAAGNVDPTPLRGKSKIIKQK